MAEFVTRSAVWAICGALVSASAFFFPLARAQVLSDPTRPPGVVSGEEDAAASAGPVLQSILSRAGRKEAIISGHTVTVGDRFGDARVVSIGDAEVVLRNGSELQTLKLFPAIEKRMGASRNEAKTGLREQDKK